MATYADALGNKLPEIAVSYSVVTNVVDAAGTSITLPHEFFLLVPRKELKVQIAKTLKPLNRP